MLTTDAAVNTVRICAQSERTARVNTLLAGSTLDPLPLQWKALLVTALREQGVWPQGCKT